MISLYVDGSSFVHRAPAAIKFLVLFAVLALVFLVNEPAVIALVGGAALALFAVTGLGIRRALRDIRPVLPIAALVVLVQVVVAQPERGLLLSCRLVVAVLLASLLTHTTTTTRMLDLVYRVLAPLRPVGVDAWQAGLTLSLAITSIPVVSGSVRASREAYAARGQRAGVAGIVVPVAVRLIRASEAVGDAISARGLDEDPRAAARAPRVLGPVVDDETRCVHYRTDLDVVAIKFFCCGEYYPCHLCHEETAGHPAERWPVAERGRKAILCGVCASEIPIAEYLLADACPRCAAAFNPGCRLHSHLYFEPEPLPER